jgi:hypothetical protein
MATDEHGLIVLKNSNALNKYPVDATNLNYNFNQVLDRSGYSTVENFISSSGQTYAAYITNQLATAVTQYILSAYIFSAAGTGNEFVLVPQQGYALPYKYVEHMRVTFVSSRTNTGASVCRFTNLDTAYPILLDGVALKSGTIPINTPMTLIFTGNAWEIVENEYNTASGASTFTQDAIRTIVESIGETYLPTDTTQLMDSVVQYITNSTYTATYSSGIFTLDSFGNQGMPQVYTEGMILHFVSPTTTNTPALGIKLGELATVGFVGHNGSALAVGAITVNEMLTVIYQSGAFRLISQYIPRLVMQNGVPVTSISNDASLTNATATALVTEAAVKSYVDVRASSVFPNLIVSGYTSEDTPAALQLVGSRAIQTIVGSNADTYTVWEKTPNSVAHITTSGDYAALAVNMVSKVSTVYWSSGAPNTYVNAGWGVDALSRIVAGTTGSKYVTIETDAEGNPVYLPGRTPQYIKFSGIMEYPGIIRMKHPATYNVPTTINVQISLDGTTWCNVVDNTSYTNIDTSLVLFTTYGNLSTTNLDNNGFYNIILPSKVVVDSTLTTVEEYIPSGSSFYLKIQATLFNSEYPTSTTINAENYDPNTDTINGIAANSPSYPWAISEIQLGTVISVAPALNLTYPSNTIESITTPVYFTQYVEDTPSTSTTPGAVSLVSYTAGQYIIYKTYGDTQLRIIPADKYYIQTTAPEASAANVGALWVDVTSSPYTTYICTGEDMVYSWVSGTYMALGKCTIDSSNTITICETYSYGREQVYEVAVSPTFTEQFIHNFGFDCTVDCFLLCIADANSYTAGEMVYLTPYADATYTLNTNANPLLMTLTKIPTYLSLSDTITDLTVIGKNLKVLNRNTADLEVITEDSWKLKVYITKD